MASVVSITVLALTTPVTFNSATIAIGNINIVYCGLRRCFSQYFLVYGLCLLKFLIQFIPAKQNPLLRQLHWVYCLVLCVELLCFNIRSIGLCEAEVISFCNEKLMIKSTFQYTHTHTHTHKRTYKCTVQSEIYDLKDQISHQSKKNFKLERDLRFLDSKIALLINHKISIEVS